MASITSREPSIVLKTSFFDELMAARDCETDEQCAKELRLHRSTVSRMRAHERTPSGEVMFQVSEVLGVPIQKLFIRPEQEES